MTKINASATEVSGIIGNLQRELKKVVIGQETMINRLLIGLFTGGHVLLEGVPGLAKTLTVSTLAKALDLKFQRIQFTPDLLPADLVGTLIYNPQQGSFQVKKGPIFANIILADEINRAPAKVQSALLEAMQEKQVTIGETTFKLDRPFLVLATQNPIDQEGTYPLPEAQVDRFMMKIAVDYPTAEEELQIMRQMARTTPLPDINPVLNAQQITNIRVAVEGVALSERLEQYIVALVQATRKPEKVGAEKLKKYIEFGASPRATIALNLAARTFALIQGRNHTTADDLKAVASDVLNHRLVLSYEAEADGITPRQVVSQLLNTIKI